MKPLLKIGIGLLAFGLLLAVLGAGLIRAHSHRTKLDPVVTTQSIPSDAKSGAAPAQAAPAK